MLKKMMREDAFWCIRKGALLFLAALAVLALNAGFIKEVKAAIDYGLPVIYINTDSGKDITSKKEYVPATMTMQKNDKFQDDKYYFNGKIDIKGRGNSTWSQNKKPYHIKLDSKTNLLGLGKSKHWYLLANSYDDSFMRNKISYDFAYKMGIYGLESDYVDLVLNGKYLGTYQLCEAIRIEKNRVDITNWESIAEDVADAIGAASGLSKSQISTFSDQLEQNLAWITKGVVTFNGKSYTVTDYYQDMPLNEEGLPDMSGGWLFEIGHNNDEGTYVTTSKGKKMYLRSPEMLGTNSRMQSNVENFFSKFETCLYSNDHTAVIDGKRVSYVDFADIDSMVKYYMTQEIFMQGDSGSHYAYKDVGSKLFFGPVWDMDHAMTSTASNQWFEKKITEWLREAARDPYFITKWVETYNKYREELRNITKSGGEMDNIYNYIQRSAAANFNNSKKLKNAMDSLKSILNSRFSYTDSKMTSVGTFLKEYGEVSPNSVMSVKSAQDSPKTMKFTATSTDSRVKKVAFYVNGRYVGIYDMQDGRAEYTLNDPELLDEMGSQNCVVVRGCNANSNLISSGTLMNYINFENNGIGSGEVVFEKDSYVLTKGTTKAPWKVMFAGKECTDEETLKELEVEFTNIDKFSSEKLKGLEIVKYVSPGKIQIINSGVVKIVAKLGDSTAEATIIVPGDVNCDGKVSAKDAQMLAKIIRGKKELDGGYARQLADMNIDGKIDISDLNEIVKEASK